MGATGLPLLSAILLALCVSYIQGKLSYFIKIITEKKNFSDDEILTGSQNGETKKNWIPESVGKRRMSSHSIRKRNLWPQSLTAIWVWRNCLTHNKENLQYFHSIFIVRKQDGCQLLSWQFLFIFWREKGRVGFEKLSEMDYRGNTYYTIRNLSLYECQGWCREEPDCAAASFRFFSFFLDNIFAKNIIFFLLSPWWWRWCGGYILLYRLTVLWSTLWRPSRRLSVCSRTRRLALIRPSILKSPSRLITWSSWTSDQVP